MILKSGKQKKRSSVGKKLLYILTSLIGVVVILMSCAYGAFYHYYSKMNIVAAGEEDFLTVSDSEPNNDDLDVNTMTDEEKAQLEEMNNSYKPGNIDYDFSDPDITNIMILGTDARLKGRYRTNSDAMVLVSINKRTNKLFISSFMRDILVDIPKGGNHKTEGKGKLNAAFGYGGSKLLFQTYEKNFGIKFDKYVHLDLFDFINMINYLGGIDMYITAAETQAMNYPHIWEMNRLTGKAEGYNYLPKKSGTYHLNGVQALAYTRVRYVGGGDFGRTERQRKVIAEMIKKIKKMSLKKLNAFVERCLHYVTTNIGQTEILSLAKDAPEIMDYEQVNIRIPIDNTYKSGKLKGTYILTIDLQKNADYWYSLVYLDKDISEDINKRIVEEKAEAEAKAKAEEEAKAAAESQTEEENGVTSSDGN